MGIAGYYYSNQAINKIVPEQTAKAQATLTNDNISLGDLIVLNNLFGNDNNTINTRDLAGLIVIDRIMDR